MTDWLDWFSLAVGILNVFASGLLFSRRRHGFAALNGACAVLNLFLALT